MQRIWFIENKEDGEYKQQEEPRETNFIEVATEHTSDMRGSKRDWIFRVQVINNNFFTILINNFLVLLIFLINLFN